MKQKLWNYLATAVLMGLLIAGSIFSIGWALTTVQIIFWVLYPLAYLVLILCFVLYIDGEHKAKMRKAFNQPLTAGTIKSAIYIGLMIYAGLIALPVVAILWYILFLAMRKVVLEEE